MNKLTEFKPVTITDMFRPDDLFLTVSDRIKLYVHNQLLNFLKENKIPEKRWFKHGVIEKLPDVLSGMSYIFYYKTLFRKVQRKITIEYSMEV